MRCRPFSCEGRGTDLELSNWLEAAADSARELATGTLAASSTAWEALSHPVLPDDLCGVYIPLLNGHLALQLGLLAHRDVCSHLARALLGMAPDEPLDSEADVFDAVGEVTNLVAGGLKARMSDHTDVSLGVPLAIQGRVFPSSGSQSVQGILHIDANAVWLVMTSTSGRLKASHRSADNHRTVTT